MSEDGQSGGSTLAGGDQALLTKAGMVDAEEDERWGEDFRGDELPEELQRSREAPGGDRQAAKARLEAAQRGRDAERGREPGQDRNPSGAGGTYKRAYGEPAPKAPEQFHGRSREPDHEDQQRGIPAVLQRADGGRWGAPDHRRGSGGATGQRPGSAGGDARRDQRDVWGRACGGTGRCGLLQRAGSVGAGRSRHRRARSAGASKASLQLAVDPARLPATHRMGEKLARAAGKARYAQRKWLSEAPNGWIKEVLGFRRFSLRGLAKVRGEWDLVCLALNIKRMGTVATC